MKHLTPAVLTLLLVATSSNAENLVPYQDSTAVLAGKTIYADQCAACHGGDLQGEPDWHITKDNGLRAAPPHDENGHTWHHSDAQLFDLTKYGLTAIMARKGMAYESDMTGFGDVLSDKEILAALAYIKSTWPPRVVETHNEINASE